jgi:acyl carrier protein
VPDILDKITEIVREELENDSIVLHANTQAKDVPGWDSLAHVRIVVSIEEAFDVEFDTSKVTALKNVGDLLQLLESTLAHS